MAEQMAAGRDAEGSLAAVLRPAEFQARTTSLDGTTSVRLEGELDMATAPQLAKALATALARRPARLALDLSDLTFIDSTGMRVLIAARNRAADSGCSFVLRSPGRAVRKALRLTGFDQLLDIEDEQPAS